MSAAAAARGRLFAQQRSREPSSGPIAKSVANAQQGNASCAQAGRIAAVLAQTGAQALCEG